MDNKNQSISVIIVTYGRIEGISECLTSVCSQNYSDFEVIFVDNNEDLEISHKVKEVVESFNDNRITYIKSDTNTGVAGGRNIGIQESSGNILVFIDDDAFFDSTESFTRLIHFFRDREDLGIVVFQIRNFFSKKINPKEFPHRNKGLVSQDVLETTYFVGAGHAIRREVFQKVSLYDPALFYSMQELELSLRVMEAGYRIFYFSPIVVWHMESPEGRFGDEWKWQDTLQNRIWLSILHLPWRFVVISSFLWSLKILLLTKSLKVIGRAYKHIFSNLDTLLKRRNPIRSETVRKIQRLQGRLYY